MSDSENRAPIRSNDPEYSKHSNFRVLTSYNDVVRSLVALIDGASKEIHLASRYYEPVIGSKLVQKFSQGVSLNILDGNPSGTTFVERIRQVARLPTKERELLNSILDSPKVRIRRAIIEYSFIVVDQFHCAFELHNPLNPTQFYRGIAVDDREMAETLIALFTESLEVQQIDERKHSGHI